ncbi:MAG: methyl-accepting chemotaxis protein [Planctomycetota bacterium]
MIQKFKSLGLATRIISLTLLVLVTVVALNYIVFVDSYQDAAQDAMTEKAAAFTATADEAKNFAAKNLVEAGVLNGQALRDDLKKTLAEGKTYKDAKIFNTLPVVVGWKSAEAAAEREGINFRVSAFDARNPENAPQDDFSKQLLTDLKAQAKADPTGASDTIARVDEATNTLHFMRAIRLTADCLSCHGDPNTSPTGNGKDILGFPMENWTAGRVHGANHVIMPRDQVDAQTASFITNGLMWTAPVVIGAVILFVFALRMMFGKPVKTLIERIKDIAQGEGDLTARVPINSQDEIGQLGTWFNTFVAKIHDVILEVSGATRDVASAATEIAASSEEMAAGMSEQSGQIQQVSAAVEEMSASVVEVAKKSADASNSAQHSGETAEQGGTVVQDTIAGMTSISEAVVASAASVQELGKRGDEIGQVINVINDIADQTNLLALNAAIEAARAGEHGRGFAVVADEVRKLADRTTQATEEIADSITAIQSETTGAVDKMNAGTEQVEVGVAKAREAGESLSQIVSSANEVAEMIRSIAAAAEQQSAAAEEVSGSVDAIAQVTRQATEGTSQAAQAAAQLSTKSEQLLQLVGSFKVDAHGRATNPDQPTEHDNVETELVGNDKLKAAAAEFRRQHA